jgi:hypothetical protein
VNRRHGDGGDDVLGLSLPEPPAKVLARKPAPDLAEQTRTHDSLELGVKHRGEDQRRRTLGPSGNTGE